MRHVVRYEGWGQEKVNSCQSKAVKWVIYTVSKSLEVTGHEQNNVHGSH